MAPGAVGRRAGGEEIEGKVGKPLPGRWDEATTPGSCKPRTSRLGKSGSKQSLKDGWKKEPLSL